MSITNVGQSPRIVMLPAPTADVDLWDVLNLQGGERLYVNMPRAATVGNPPITYRLDISKPRPWSTILPIELNLYTASSSTVPTLLQVRMRNPDSSFYDIVNVSVLGSNTPFMSVVNFKIWTLSQAQVMVAWHIISAGNMSQPDGLANGKRVDLNT